MSQKKKSAGEKPDAVMEKLVSLSKRRGFVFQSSEIYGGLASCWDYGPLGVELKRNIKDAWWNAMTKHYDNIVGLDSAIMMNPRVWEASGHVDSFNDPMIDDKTSKRRYRADHLIEGYIASLEKKGKTEEAARVQGEYHKALATEPLVKSLYDLIIKEEIKAPDSGAFNWTEVRQFNLMFQAPLGAVADEASIVYLRPETAQGIFVNFQTVREAARMKVPFGIAQIGKAFRNEIVKGNFIFRMIEFEQMEMQYFVKPGTQMEAFEEWRERRMSWYTESLGISKEKLHWYKHDQLAHYADAAYDIKFEFPFGIEEIEGIHSRTDFDLRRHQEYSGKSMEYFDQESKERYLPYVVETSAGSDRLFLAVLSDAYTEDEIDGESRVSLNLHPNLAPIKAGLFPLMKKEGMPEIAQKLQKELQKQFKVQYDDAGSIGKRYRRQDEIGTPYCFTIDHDTLQDGTVTVRDRDTTEQSRIALDQVKAFLSEKLLK
ncbi:glycyl-tRNA synthetase [Chloroherpeton thalassium ATCC 35110]|uniref:Glycine--tRNA ligase n=1 Tax=Chloroherpeton thalassium (strain ATCC 35110 / GB-78) TaxID=517418 RepID=B3QXF3_CHLT3|nr:glycine--tRNA ligase [Chloroherpeton thalassium]ACF13427.1 glycyl-tRNA synthetase [Chloroherpeton thalassium ATCC 35110]